MSFVSVTLDEFARLGEVVLIDCEFTCWEDSQRTNWSDPTRPPEVIEIGLARYSIPHDRVDEVFASFVRPRLNPELSAYCRRVLAISQEEIDHAPPLAEVFEEVETWLRSLGLGGAPTCGWGPIDRVYLTDNAKREGYVSPFHHRPHADISALCQGVLGTGTRDAVRAQCGLPENQRRHRALADALDLALFCVPLRQEAMGLPRGPRT